MLMNGILGKKVGMTTIFDATGNLLDAVIPLRKIVRDKFDSGASIVGQLIPAGGTLRFESDAVSGISWRVTGKEL